MGKSWRDYIVISRLNDGLRHYGNLSRTFERVEASIRFKGRSLDSFVLLSVRSLFNFLLFFFSILIEIDYFVFNLINFFLFHTREKRKGCFGIFFRLKIKYSRLFFTRNERLSRIFFFTFIQAQYLQSIANKREHFTLSNQRYIVLQSFFKLNFKI